MQNHTAMSPVFNDVLFEYRSLVSNFLAKEPPQPGYSKKDDLRLVSQKLAQYLDQTSYTSQVRYFLFLSSTPRLVSTEDKIIRSIIKQINEGLITSYEEVRHRLSVMDTRNNQRLSLCFAEICKGRRSSFIIPEFLTTFLNAFCVDPWNLSNVFNPTLCLHIEKLSTSLQRKICGLQSEMVLDNYRSEYFLLYIKDYLDCFSQANKAFCIGTVMDGSQPMIQVREYLNVLSQALDKTCDLLPLMEQRKQCSDLIAQIKEIPCKEFSISSDAPLKVRPSNVYWKF